MRVEAHVSVVMVTVPETMASQRAGHLAGHDNNHVLSSGVARITCDDLTPHYFYLELNLFITLTLQKDLNEARFK